MGIEQTISKKAIILAAVLATIGLAAGGTSILWLRGSLGISIAAASQIMHAIDVGGWALAVIGTIFGGGISGAVIASTKAIIKRIGKKAAID